MTTMGDIVEGFAILTKYDEDTGGEVNAGRERDIYAGAQTLEIDDYTDADRAALEELGWEFNENIQRWGIYL